MKNARTKSVLRLSASAAALALSARREWRALAQACVPALCTPVGRKIRLND